ncbi:integrase core domain-containing protein [Nannocystis pusilla]|uniref:integrase core domain-containing protein n=1 Tax=Nannocystis pusilla TaxID=889268 RepID=UPI003B7BFBC5
MHLDMRYEVEDAGAADQVAQQRKLDTWRQEFNHVRPHEALGQRTPATVYRKSPQPYIGPRAPCYPAHATVRTACSSGRIRYRGRLVRVGQGFSGYVEGVATHDPRVLRRHPRGCRRSMGQGRVRAGY